MSELLPQDYPAFLQSLKERIRQAQTRAALAVSRELMGLYWQIGRDLEAAVRQGRWGEKVIERVAGDLKREFPGVEGFSKRNLERMRAFYQAYPDEGQFAAQPVSQLPWGHNLVLLQKLKDPAQRLWYAEQALLNGWSRAILEMQVESGLYHRQGRALTNFAQTLPPPGSDLAQQVLKDPYNFDFLTLHKEANERHLERALLEHLQRFMLELGVGFAFVGSQYPLEVDGQDYYLDLLFYHLKLRCYVVIDLKMTEFKPEYAGKMNFYLSAVDDLLRHPTDGPTLGLILCKSKRKLTVEYALRDLAKPLGVSSFQLAEALPKELEAALPSVEQLEAELRRDDEQSDN
ncbi:YhcG family protein [Meiothermus sp.]|uniref:PDDEXK nuclease domain-containing protein n=1 Tax=Meiothermus sp. TaxID=1955249 RepID=UPI0026099FD5|nr:PDDEXK nuclease domain-containing protein [Meiothermus sp.]